MQALKWPWHLVAVKTCMRTAAANSAPISKFNSEAKHSLKSWRKIPGPKSLPFIGSLRNFLPGGELHGCIGMRLFEKLYKKYGPIVRVDTMFGTPNTIMLFDANAVEHVLRSENSTPIRPGSASLEYYRKRHNKHYDPHRQTGLVTDHGKNWKDLRSKVNHIMLQPKHIKLYSDDFEKVSNDMIARIKSIRDENNTIKEKFDVHMNLWALESIGVVALGTRLNCLEPNQTEHTEARKLLQNIRNILAITEKVDVGPSLWRYFSTSNFKRAMALYEEQERLTKFFIDKSIGRMKEAKHDETKQKSDAEKSILEKLLDIDVELASTMTPDLVMAGVDTAANTAMATLYLLAKNPEKQNKLREEVLAKPSRRPYLRACIKESLRLLPIVTGNVRITTKEYNLLGYKIPKNQLLFFAHQYMSSMKEHYAKPDEFIPERWVAEKTDPLYHGNAHPFAYSPFGYGVRMCIGIRVAELEMETFLSKVVENFQIEWQGAPLNVAPTTLNFIKGPFGFIFKDLTL